jgi:2-methylcitrate dehydratase PrpD
VSSVCARLTEFVRGQQARGVPAFARHEAQRLILNQLKASVGASTHPAVQILNDWAASHGYLQAHCGATVLWLGTSTSGEYAAMVNAALFEVLDFNETYIPTFQHAVSGVLPAVLAIAEAGCHSGAEVLDALALGIEVELACAAILMPTGYFRGFIPGGITGAIGGAAACAILLGLDDMQFCNALGLAMNSGMGFYQSAGSSALPYVMAATARNGMVACELARRGIDAPDLAFEGDKAMLSAYSDEPASKIEIILGTLGAPDAAWRIMGQSYKTVPTETITHGPIECTLALLARAQGRAPARLHFGVAPIVVTIANERAARWGAPTTELEAKFDLRHCAAAAWVRSHFTLAEMLAPAFTDPAILDLRARIELIADPAQTNFEGATLTIDYVDGTTDHIAIPAFRGTPGNPVTDDELSSLFRQSAAPSLPAAQIDAVLAAIWALGDAPDISGLIHACTPPKETS